MSPQPDGSGDAAPARPSALQPAAGTPGAPPDSDSLTLNPAVFSIWKDGVGNGFRPGVTEVGGSVGASLGSRILGSTDAHDLALTKLLIGRVTSDVVATNKWYRGNWEVLGELFGGGQFEPQKAYVIGVTPALRYDFATGTRWVPFFDVGAGVTATDIGHPDLGGKFQFNLQTGPGLNWFIRSHTVLTLQYRFMHISNASLENPDHGLNTSVLYGGISWFF